MKKLILFAAVAGLGLVSAKPPEAADGGAGAGMRGSRVYPPCSRTVTDSCIQRHERRAHRSVLPRRVRMAGERG